MALWTQDRFDGGLNEIHELAPNSLSTLTNAYISDDGTIMKRGGKTVAMTLAVAANADTNNDCLLYGSTTGYLFKDASAGAFSKIAAPTETAITGLKWYHASWTTLAIPTSRVREHHSDTPSEMIYSDGSRMYRWCGLATAGYSTGTVSGTAGATAVTGSSTVWSSNVSAGMYFILESSNPQVYVIDSVDSNTAITLDRALDTSPSGANYSIQSIAPVTTPESTLVYSSSNSTNILMGTCSAYHQSRLFFEGETGILRWTATPQEVHATDSSAKGISYQTLNAYIDVGFDIRALVSYGQDLLIFGANQVSVLRGDVSTDGTDLGAFIARVHGFAGVNTPDAVCATPLGIVFLHSSGPYIYRDGQAVPFGQDVVNAAASGDGGSVSIVDEASDPRIIIGVFPNNQIYEFDIKRGTWAKQRFDTTYYPSRPVKGLSFEHAFGTVVYWIGDRSQSSEFDGNSTSQPRITVTTQPIRLRGDGVRLGRPSTIYLSGFATTPVGADALLSVSVGGTNFSGSWLPGLEGANSRHKPPTTFVGLASSMSVSIVTSDEYDFAQIQGIGVEIEEANAI